MSPALHNLLDGFAILLLLHIAARALLTHLFAACLPRRNAGGGLDARTGLSPAPFTRRADGR